MNNNGYILGTDDILCSEIGFHPQMLALRGYQLYLGYRRYKAHYRNIILELLRSCGDLVHLHFHLNHIHK